MVGFLTDQENGSLRINHMILHVVGGEDGFEPQAELENIEHEEFFLARIQDTAIESVWRFNEESTTKSTVESMSSGDVGFEAGAQQLSRDFSGRHVGASRDGAFFVFELSCADPDVVLYCLIKYDYRQVIELYEREGRSALRQIVQAFVKEKRAVQKSCIVRVREGVAELGVSTTDRMAVQPELTDYFKTFLDVSRDRTDEELNQSLNEVVRAALSDCRQFLPAGGVPAAFRAVQDSLSAREQVDEDAVREAVFVAAGRPADENTRAELDKSVNRQLKRKRLSGLTFPPAPLVLRRAPRRRMKTAEGVLVEFPGEQEGRAVSRTVNANGGSTITITTTQGLLEDETVPDRNSRGD